MSYKQIYYFGVFSLILGMCACSRGREGILVFQTTRNEVQITVTRVDKFPDRDVILVEVSRGGKVIQGPSYVGPDPGDVDLRDVGTDEVIAIAASAAPNKILIGFDTTTSEFWHGQVKGETKSKLADKLKKTIDALEFVEWTGSLGR